MKENGLIAVYSGLIFKHPGKILLALLVLSFAIAGKASNVETVEQQTEDFLPESEPVIEAFNVLDAEFGSASGTKYTILIQTEPDHANSTEIRDVRDPRFLRYMETVTNEISSLNKVSSVESPSSLFSQTPSSLRETQAALSQLGEGRWSQFISEDYQAAKIVVSSTGLKESEKQEVANMIRNIIEAKDLSSDFQIGYTGQIYIDQAFQNQSQKTMNLTSAASLIGVMIVVIFLFRSVYYGLNSLLTVIFGVAVGFGIYGLLGMNMTPQTSGAISLGIGIAIDFGIQPIARYREERKDKEIRQSLQETIAGVITPMTVGLMAANIGFLALAVGKLTFLKDLGILLTLTTTVAYVAAFTVIPASIVFYDIYLTGENSVINLKDILR